MATQKSIRERFFAKVDTNGPIPAHRPDLGQCHVWLAGHNNAGYGYFAVKENGSWGMALAHRIVWILSYGSIPKGKYVCHHCDNPSCVRLSHLFLGDAQTNLDDAVAKGRMASGERHGLHLHPERAATGDRNGSRTHPEKRPRGIGNTMAKLNEGKVRRIRAALALGIIQREIALRFGVNQTVISSIKRGKIWRHVQ